MTKNTINLCFDSIQAGDRLPDLEVEVTGSTVVTGALASSDYEAIHHDRHAALAAGLPDIIMNTPTYNGWIGRYLTDWAGPRALLSRIQFKMGVPTCPNSTMTIAGYVLQTYSSQGQDLVDVDIKIKSDMGYAVTGSATLKFNAMG